VPQVAAANAERINLINALLGAAPDVSMVADMLEALDAGDKTAQECCTSSAARKALEARHLPYPQLLKEPLLLSNEFLSKASRTPYIRIAAYPVVIIATTSSRWLSQE
jgi:hypothetical protein